MSSQVVHVLLEQPTARARYAIEQVLGTMLGWKVHWAGSTTELSTTLGPRLVYGHTEVPGALRVIPFGYLSEQGVPSMDPSVVDVAGMPALFPVAGGDLPFDPFAGACFLLARHEEVAGLPLDMHDRPVTAELHGARHGYLQRPIVDEWALWLASVWKARDPSVPEPMRRYRQVCTIDLDNGFKYLGRPWWRSLGSAARDVLAGNWKEVRDRIAVLRGTMPDPFDIYEQLRTQISSASDRVHFFVLCAPRGPWDHAVPVDHSAYAERLRHLVSWAEVGLHPGYDSSRRPANIACEIAALEQVIGRRVQHSRQHFLRMRIPATLREVEGMGIQEEHSMGLHDLPGFRAGTCTPYPWFDLEQDRQTGLVMHPFTVMDNTLKVKLALGPQEAMSVVLPLIAAVRRVEGTFTGLWHESFLGMQRGNEAWRDAILRIIQAARP